MGKRIIRVFILLCLLSGVLSAGGWNNTLLGIRAIAIGGAFSGIADDPSAIYYNPAGLVQQESGLAVSISGFHIRPVYNIGEKSGIRLKTVIPTLLWLLFKGFWRRMFHKYVLKNFHPLVFFYTLAFLLLSCSFPLTIRLLYVWSATGDIPDMNALLLSFTLISGLQLLLFGMWFDMDYNKHLK